MSVLPKISPPSQNTPTETPDTTSASGAESSTVVSVAVFASLGGIMGLLTIVVFSIIVAITVAKHKYKSRRSVYLFTRPFSKLFTTVLCCSKADLCTTTENVAYVSTLKPVTGPAGQNQVYEEIHRSDMSTYHTLP